MHMLTSHGESEHVWCARSSPADLVALKYIKSVAHSAGFEYNSLCGASCSRVIIEIIIYPEQSCGQCQVRRGLYDLEQLLATTSHHHQELTRESVAAGWELSLHPFWLDLLLQLVYERHCLRWQQRLRGDEET